MDWYDFFRQLIFAYYYWIGLYLFVVFIMIVNDISLVILNWTLSLENLICSPAIGHPFVTEGKWTPETTCKYILHKNLLFREKLN